MVVRRDGQYVERMVYNVASAKPSMFKDGLARPKRGKPIMYSTTRCDFLKRDKDFVSVEFRIFLFKSQKPVLSLSCLVYVANFVSLFLQRERP